MYKVLIVDDEPMIREGLTTIIDWSKHGFTVAGTAANGKDAVRKHEELKPELLLIDIRMPGMDGLEVIAKIRERDASCHILILSGYADFTYAKKAISLNVDGYILKPIDEDELETYARQIRSSLSQRTEQHESSALTASLLRDDLLHRASDGKLEEDAEEYAQLEQLLGPPAKSYQLLLIELYSREHSLTRNETVKEKLSKEAENGGFGYVFASEPYVGILLKDYVWSASGKEQLQAIIAGSINDSARYIGAASAPVRKLRELQPWSAAVRRQLKRRFMLDGGAIHMAEDPEEAEVPGSSAEGGLDLDELAQKLYYRLDIGNADGLSRSVKEVSAAIVEHDSEEQSVKSAWAQLLTAVLNKAAVSNPLVSVQEDLTMITQLYLAHHYDEMLEQLNGRLLALASKLGGADSASTLKQITDFIERHYGENLKLETLAELFNYNSGYLGKMFKSYTGESFNTYLDQVRMKHAVELLQDGMMVHQVSARVGYANVDYFHSKFKKYMGVSPSSYKGVPAKKAEEQGSDS